MSTVGRSTVENNFYEIQYQRSTVDSWQFIYCRQLTGRQSTILIMYMYCRWLTSRQLTILIMRIYCRRLTGRQLTVLKTPMNCRRLTGRQLTIDSPENANELLTVDRSTVDNWQFLKMPVNCRLLTGRQLTILTMLKCIVPNMNVCKYWPLNSRQ